MNAKETMMISRRGLLIASAGGALLSTTTDREAQVPNGGSEAALAAYRQAVADAGRNRIEAAEFVVSRRPSDEAARPV